MAAALLILLLTATAAQASGSRPGDVRVEIRQLCESELPDLADGTLDDWRRVFGHPTLTEADFISHAEVGDGAAIGAPDLAANVYLGWYGPGNQLYVAVERWDDVYVSAFPERVNWHSDTVEIMVDGDHSGGLYWFTDDDLEPDGGSKRDMDQRQAQEYFATAWSRDGRLLYYNGNGLPGSQWVVEPPFADAHGVMGDGDPHYSAVELVVTPFDTLRWDSPAESVVSPLYAGKVIGLNVALVDFDSVEGPARGYHTLTGARVTYRDASTFVDALLVGCDCEGSAVRASGWGTVKARIRSNNTDERGRPDPEP